MSSAVTINLQSSVVRQFGVACGETKAPYDMLDNRGVAGYYTEPLRLPRAKEKQVQHYVPTATLKVDAERSVLYTTQALQKPSTYPQKLLQGQC